MLCPWGASSTAWQDPASLFCAVIAHSLNSLRESCTGPAAKALVSRGMLQPLLFFHPIVLKPGVLFSSSLVFWYQICFSHQDLQQRMRRSSLFQVQVAFTVCFDRSSHFREEYCESSMGCVCPCNITMAKGFMLKRPQNVF